MTDTPIPPESEEAAAMEMAPHPWGLYTEAAKDYLRRKACAALLAGLKNWPGMDNLVAGEIHDKPVVILPLPEQPDDK